MLPPHFRVIALNLMHRNLAISFALVVVAIFLVSMATVLLETRKLEAVDEELTALKTTLLASEKLHPAIGAIAPILELSDDGSYFFLVLHENGELIDGNIRSATPAYNVMLGAQIDAYKVSTGGDVLDARGFWLDIDGVAHLFVGKLNEPWSILNWSLFVAASVGISALLLGSHHWERISGIYYSKQFEKHLLGIEKAIQGNGEIERHGSQNATPEYSKILARVATLSRKLRSAKNRELEFHRAMEHEVLRYIREALDQLDHLSHEHHLPQLEGKLEIAEQNFLGLMELDAIGLALREKFVAVDLERCLKKIIVSMENEAQLLDSNIVLQIASIDVPHANGLEKHFGLLFSNLLLNALQYSPPGSEIEVRLQKNELGQPRVIIRDAGLGLMGFHRTFDPEKGPKKIGLRGSSGNVRKGTGVGLMIVYAEAELLSAEISMSDRGISHELPGLEVMVSAQAFPQH